MTLTSLSPGMCYHVNLSLGVMPSMFGLTMSNGLGKSTNLTWDPGNMAPLSG